MTILRDEERDEIGTADNCQRRAAVGRRPAKAVDEPGV